MVRETEMSYDITNYIVSATAQACRVSQCTELFPVLQVPLHLCCGVALQQSNPLFSSCQNEPLMLADRVSVFWVAKVRESLNL